MFIIPVRPLSWEKKINSNALIAKGANRNYQIVPDSKGKYKVGYQREGFAMKFATGYTSIIEAKYWCNDHYQRKMAMWVYSIADIEAGCCENYPNI